MFAEIAQVLVWSYFRRAGITIDGLDRHDVHVHNRGFYWRLLLAKLHGKQSLAFAESYMDGWWESDALDVTIEKILRSRSRKNRWLVRLLRRVRARFSNPQSKRRARESIGKHYDLGIDFFKIILGRVMVYSCALWRWGIDDLETAQRAKNEYVIAKTRPRRDDTFLDIGCGFGELMAEAAYQGLQVRGITLSQDQLAMAEQRCAGLHAEAVLRDYRDETGKYKRIVSVGMIEHVGAANYDAFFGKVADLLEADGIAVIHGIVGSGIPDPFYTEYIFEEGELLHLPTVTRAIERHLQILDEEMIGGSNYERTLREWRERFRTNREYFRNRYSERFCRMVEYYFSSAMAKFRVDGYVVQFVLAHKDFDPRQYKIVRWVSYPPAH